MSLIISPDRGSALTCYHSGMTVGDGRYEFAAQDRHRYVRDVLTSSSQKKIVVAGPGTGKSFLFRKILEGKADTLTLTFVNALVEDLSLDLFGLSEVKTLHAFARQQLVRITRRPVQIFPKLSAVIRQDALALLGKAVDFDLLFHNKVDEDENINFYRKRRGYYGHYGFSDIIYAAVRAFEINPEIIPTYIQVLVDEFQDFNALEVALIDLLALKSPVLLVGDDDQALYETLKSASTRHIRDRHTNAASEYQPFSLPYCSRCTRVIVEATNDIIRGAAKECYLRGRIEKPFRYFDDREKDLESERYPSLIYRQMFAKQIPWFIQKCIEEIAKEVREIFSVLVISPTRIQCKTISEALRGKGFVNLHFMEKQENPEPTLLEGLSLLLEDDTSNLGWCVTARALLPKADFEPLLRETASEDNPPAFPEIIPSGLRKEVRASLRVLRAASKRERGNDEATSKLLKQLGVDPAEKTVEFLCDQLPLSIQTSVDFGIRKMPITVTTIPGSKGLSADYVFITHFDDVYFIKSKDKSIVSDQDICNFLVALTRAKREIFLISSDKAKVPKFLRWIDSARVSTA